MAAALGRRQAEEMHDRAATLMVENPRRILMALFPLSGTWTWPHPHMSLVELLTCARTIIRNEPNYIGLPAVLAAEEALVRLLAPAANRVAARAA